MMVKVSLTMEEAKALSENDAVMSNTILGPKIKRILSPCTKNRGFDWCRGDCVRQAMYYLVTSHCSLNGYEFPATSIDKWPVIKWQTKLATYKQRKFLPIGYKDLFEMKKNKVIELYTSMKQYYFYVAQSGDQKKWDQDCEKFLRENFQDWDENELSLDDIAKEFNSKMNRKVYYRPLSVAINKLKKQVKECNVCTMKSLDVYTLKCGRHSLCKTCMMNKAKSQSLTRKRKCKQTSDNLFVLNMCPSRCKGYHGENFIISKDGVIEPLRKKLKC